MQKGGKTALTIEVALLLSIVSVCFSAYFGLKNNKRSDTKELEERVKENTRINMKLDSISINTKEIKDELTEMRKSINSHDTKIVKLEESVKSAHKRIDAITMKGGGEHEDER